MYHEATAPNDKALESYLEEYKDHIKVKPTNMVIRKRIVAIHKSLNRPNDAINELITLLDISPTDAEAWSELAELYVSQGMYSQAVYSFEEVLLVTPNAWNVRRSSSEIIISAHRSQIHARVAEVNYLAALREGGSNDKGALAEGIARSIKNYCRSIELCDDYLRGYYGLKLVSDFF